MVGIFLISYHVFLLLSLPLYFWNSSPALGTVIAAVVLYFLTGLSITAGYHRYFSHRAYKATGVFEVLTLFFGSMATQGSALRWSFDHRLHHAYVDTEDDPYSIKKGFWYAHCLWLFEKPRVIDPKVVSDLMKNRLVMLQHRFFGLCMVVTNGLAFLFVGWLFNDYLGAFFIALWLRLFALHHSTWFINSLAHTWGDKPFSEEQSAVNNYVLSLLTFGEGYHNYHHTFANDYRNGIRWFHYDPTKWLIWTLEKLRLAFDLRFVDDMTIQRRLVIKRKDLLLDRLKGLWNAQELEKTIQSLSDQLLTHLEALSELKKQCRQYKKDRTREMRHELKMLKKNLRQDFRSWRYLSRKVLKLKPL